VAVDGVLAEDQRERDLPVREALRDEAKDLGLAAAERRAAVRLGLRSVAEESDATVRGDNPRVVALASRLARASAGSWDGGELELVLAL
jgi:hypothetical protein